MVFLFVHFGRNKSTGWRLARDIYGGLGGALQWSWALVSANPVNFRDWLNDHQAILRGGDVALHGASETTENTRALTPARLPAQERQLRPMSIGCGWRRASRVVLAGPKGNTTGHRRLASTTFISR